MNIYGQRRKANRIHGASEFKCEKKGTFKENDIMEEYRRISFKKRIVSSVKYQKVQLR